MPPESDLITAVIDPVEGPLQCKKHHGEKWCKELQEYVHENRDAQHIMLNVDKLIGNDMPPEGDDPCCEITVPILPSKDEWLTVKLFAWQPHLYQVCAPRPKAWQREGEYNRSTIGMVGPGDGRLAIFYMFTDWLNSFNDPACTSNQHGYKEEMEVNRLKAGKSADRLVLDWSIYNTGMCPGCDKKSNDDFDDLLPDFEERKWKDDVQPPF